MLSDGDGEADVGLSADRDDVLGVEAAVGAHGELTCGACVSHPGYGLSQEVCCATGGVGTTPSQSGHQHVAGSCGDGQQRVIASLSSVSVVSGAFLVQSVGLTDRGVEIDGQRTVPGS